MGRRIPFKLAALVLVLCAPRCATKPSDCGQVTALHATFERTGSACGEYCDMKCDDGFIQCFTDSAGCETADTIPSKHEAVIFDVPGLCSSNMGVIEKVGNCGVVCAAGFFDCNSNTSDGCEHAGACGSDSFPDGGDAGAGMIMRALADAPNGLAICGDSVVFVDGLDIDRVNRQTLTFDHVTHSASKIAGGLACDDTLVYWTTLSDADAAPTGFVMSAVIQGSAPLELASGVDPLAGIDVRDGVLYFMTSSSGLATVSTIDAGVVPDYMPASGTGAYKPFATGQLGDFSIASGAIHQRSSDASASSVWLDDAASASAIFTNGSGAPFAVFRDAGPSGDLVFRLMDDAGAPAMVAAEPQALGRVVATTSGGDVAIVASATTLYAVSTSLGIATTIATPGVPIADVVTDGTLVWFTTAASGQTPAELRRAVIP